MRIIVFLSSIVLIILWSFILAYAYGMSSFGGSTNISLFERTATICVYLYFLIRMHSCFFMPKRRQLAYIIMGYLLPIPMLIIFFQNFSMSVIYILIILMVYEFLWFFMLLDKLKQT